MFARIFRGCREESVSNSSSHKLKKALEKLQEKEIVLQKKISIEVERAKEFTKAKNKRAAMQCLKRKRFYETQIEHLEGFQSRIHDQELKLPPKSPVQCRQVQSVVSKNSTKNIEA